MVCYCDHCGSSETTPPRQRGYVAYYPAGRWCRLQRSAGHYQGTLAATTDTTSITKNSLTGN